MPHCGRVIGADIFTGYTGDNFRLAAGTEAGKDVAAEPWWNDTSDPYFGSLDNAADMYGSTRGEDGVWDRGAVEYSKMNIECRTPNVEYRIPSLPAPINDLPLTIDDLRIYNATGKLVRADQPIQSGIYLVLVGNKLQKIAVVK